MAGQEGPCALYHQGRLLGGDDGVELVRQSARADGPAMSELGMRVKDEEGVGWARKARALKDPEAYQALAEHGQGDKVQLYLQGY